MNMKLSLGVLIVAAFVSCAPAEAQRRADQREVYDQMRDGRILPVKEIERRVLPMMTNARYLGFDFDAMTGIYTLKFLRNGIVIWVDVDGHSGHVLGRTDN